MFNSFVFTADRDLAFTELRVTFCDEILEFANKNSRTNEIGLISDFKDLLSNHVLTIKNDLNELSSIAKEISICSESKSTFPIQISGKQLYYKENSDNRLDVLYYIGFDNYREMHKYGNISFVPVRKGYRLSNRHIELSYYEEEEKIVQFFPLEYIKHKSKNFKYVETIEEVNGLTHDLLNHFGIKDWRDKGYEKLSRSIQDALLDASRESNQAKLRITLKLIGYNTTQEFVELVIAQRAIMSYQQEKESKIDLFGEEMYHSILAEHLSRREELTKITGYSNEELVDIVNRILEYKNDNV